MKRPFHHAKWLVLGLFKTVSALAAEPRGAMAATSWHLQQPSRSTSTDATAQRILTLRLARRTDVPAIQRCNLATLPENYSNNFYVQHLAAWPELALVVVAEENPNPNQHNPNQHNHQHNPNQHPTPLHFSPFPGNQPVSQVVAYVLGKIDERRVQDDDQHYDNNDDDDHTVLDYFRRRHGQDATMDRWTLSAPRQQQQQQRHHVIGHVTSLAVDRDYRRQGLGRALMEQLHYQFTATTTTSQQHQQQQQQQYQKQQDIDLVDTVGLHVRRYSNRQAVHLYQHVLGYQQQECIPNYYEDGEDAIYMTKALLQQQQQQQQQQHIRQLPEQEQPYTGGGLFSAWNRGTRAGNYSSNNNSISNYNNNNNNSLHPLALPRTVGHVQKHKVERGETQQQQQRRHNGSEEEQVLSAGSGEPELLTGTY
jgi:ribosomal protein S18 acetylase RimI-like enzyme